MPSGTPSITWWNRLEPRPRAAEIATTLAAPVRDACWMLTRQWMVGELHGEDAGSQAFVQLTTATSPFVGWRRRGEQAARPLDGRPFDAVVTGEHVTPDLTTRVELGATFLELLTAELAPVRPTDVLVGAIRTRYPVAEAAGARAVTSVLDADWPAGTDAVSGGTVTTALVQAFAAAGVTLAPTSTARTTDVADEWLVADPVDGRHHLVRVVGPAAAPRVRADLAAVPDVEEARFRLLCAGRALDGVELLLAARAAPVPPPFDDPQLSAGERAAAVRALAALEEWVDRVLGGVGLDDAPAWRPDVLAYEAEALVTTPDGTLASLATHPGREADVDWSALDVRAGPVTPAGVVPGPVTTVRRSVLPANVRFRGMPNARWWDFEHADVDFGDVRADRRDLVRLLVMDFLLVHGNDWFHVPSEQRVGSVCTVSALLVRDVFGNDVLVERADAGTAPDADAGEWTMFSTSVEAAAGPPRVADFFVVAPGAGTVQVGPVLEEVRFVHDETANMAWGVEHVTENGVGEPWPAHEREAAVRAALPPPATPSATAPLRYVVQTPVPEFWVPLVPVALDPARGEVAFVRAALLSGVGGLTGPAGRVLAPTDPVREDALPRTGLRVQRAASRARWVDGSTHVWVSRRRRTTASEGNSGLRFDQVVPQEPGP